MSTRQVIVKSLQKYTQEINAGGHVLTADEPLDLGGDDKGPNPYELLLSALGACTSMTLRMYADQKQWPLDSVEVLLTHDKVHAEDCATCETKTGKIDKIQREIKLKGALSAEQKERLLQIAERCPVARTLKSEIMIESKLAS